MDEVIPWRFCDENKEAIEKCKREYIMNPEKLLISTCNRKEIFEIFYYINSLRYEDKPNYLFIKNKLKEILIKEATKLNYLPIQDDSKCSNDEIFNLFKPLSTTSVENAQIESKRTAQKEIFMITKDVQRQDLLRKKRERNELLREECNNKPLYSHNQVNTTRKLFNDKIVQMTLQTCPKKIINLEKETNNINNNLISNYENFDIQSYLYFIKSIISK